MVDTARFQLGVHAVRTVSLVLAHNSRQSSTSVLDLLTWVPLDAQSIARIVDSLVDDQLVERTDDRLRWVGSSPLTQDPPNIEQGEHLEAAGFVQNLVSLRGDQDWCRKVRDQHRVVRGMATLGPSSNLEALAEHADIPPPRVRAVLGDFEAEGLIDILTREDGLDVTAPDLDYPPDRFDRNNALLTNVEERAVPVHRGWWIVLAIAAAFVILFIASRIATNIAS